MPIGGKISVRFGDEIARDANDVGFEAQAAINGLIKPGGAQPILDVLIRTFRTVQGAP